MYFHVHYPVGLFVLTFIVFAGDIGGQLGLMLGASVVTILEFVDLFVLFLYYLLSNPKRNG